jgi:chromosome segregation ATPase
MKNLYISEIQLFSQKEKKGRKVQFDPKRTLIHGKNHTGKSSLIKSIYWALGAEPLFNQKFKNANVSALLKFAIDGTQYSILRDGKLFGFYDNTGELVKKFTSVTNELGPFLSKLFNFQPLFQNQISEFITPPPAYLFLPYYIDQDYSWSKSWVSFRNLQQIKDYRNQSIYYHSGIRPNDYYSTRKEIQEFIQIIEETDKERKLTSKILSEVKEKLSQTNFNLDVESFKEEITELLTESKSLMAKEEALKNKLHDFYHLKASFDAQINIVKQAILESNKDLKFATDDLPEIIGCPTCGAEYENSFAERFEIARDEKRSKDLLFELKKDAQSVESQIEKEKESLSTITAEVSRINEILEEKKGDLKLKDIIDNAGKNQVKSIFSERYSELNDILISNAREKEELEKKLKAFENKDRKSSIVDFYNSRMASFLKKLDIHSLTEDDYKGITTIIENKETGSSRPRALIAYYFTFFHLMKKFSSSTYCPLIIDSPNQQDQDIEHIDKIMGFINHNQPDNTQMILGLAETYGEDFNCKVIELKEKYSLLQRSEYEEVADEMIIKQQGLWF